MSPGQRETDSVNERAQDAGIYEFTFADGSSVKARCEFMHIIPYKVHAYENMG